MQTYYTHKISVAGRLVSHFLDTLGTQIAQKLYQAAANGYQPLKPQYIVADLQLTLLTFVMGGSGLVHFCLLSLQIKFLTKMQFRCCKIAFHVLSYGGFNRKEELI